MKKRIFAVFYLALATSSFIFAQDINQKIRSAVDALSAGRNSPIEVNIEPVTIDGTDTPTALSRYLADRIELSAVNNTLFKIVQPTRGVGARTGGPQKGKITGTYRKAGSNVDITLKLTGAADNQIMTMANFSIPISELEKLEIAIFPANIKSEKEVKEREEILAPVKTSEQSSAMPENNNSWTIEAWPNSITRTYHNGEDLIITLLSNKNCWIKVYHIDVGGKQQMIFPNKVDRDNYMRANTELSIPKNSRFEIGPPYGQETIIAIASGSQFENLDREMDNVIKATKNTVADMTQGGRGVTVKDNRAPSQTPDAPIDVVINTRFTFTILLPSR
jgi:hypothetical protein